jgi:hypothetical protein
VLLNVAVPLKTGRINKYVNLVQEIRNVWCMAEVVIKAIGISSNRNNSTDLHTTCYRIKIRENVLQTSVPLLILFGF